MGLLNIRIKNLDFENSQKSKRISKVANNHFPHLNKIEKYKNRYLFKYFFFFISYFNLIKEEKKTRKNYSISINSSKLMLLHNKIRKVIT